MKIENELTNAKLIDGQALSDQLLQDLYTRVTKENLKPVLHILVDPNNVASQSYVNLKRNKATVVGIDVQIYNLTNSDTTETIKAKITSLTKNNQEGLILQLPLPSKFNTKELVASIPVNNDVDVLNRADTVLNHSYIQPVIGSVQLALKSIGVDSSELIKRHVHIVGGGFLVGQPIIDWLDSIGVPVVTYTKGDKLKTLTDAEVIISGVGKANLIQPDMINDGVILIDAGTSSDSGELRGDFDPGCYDKASYYTPVPGGIGPLTLAMLFQNVVTLASDKTRLQRN